MSTALSPDVYMDDIANSICRILQCYIQQQYDQSCQLYVRITIPNVNIRFVE